jgi:hypothetical protein
MDLRAVPHGYNMMPQAAHETLLTVAVYAGSALLALR